MSEHSPAGMSSVAATSLRSLAHFAHLGLRLAGWGGKAGYAMVESLPESAPRNSELATASQPELAG
jgi:hypothetical protein